MMGTFGFSLMHRLRQVVPVTLASREAPIETSLRRRAKDFLLAFHAGYALSAGPPTQMIVEDGTSDRSGYET